METITDSKLNPERLFPADPKLRGVTRELYQEVKDLPLISPHGHTAVSYTHLTLPTTPYV